MPENNLANGSNNEVGNQTVGLVQWFHLNEFEAAEKTIRECKKLGITHLRTNISWALWQQPDGKQWYDWLIPALAKELNVLPCLVHTPPALALQPKPSAPPQSPKDYADFVATVLSHYGSCFAHIELWNEPNNITSYDYTLDTDWEIFSEMVRLAAQHCRQQGKKAVLGGMNPIDPNWLRHLVRHNALQHIDVVGLHNFPDDAEANPQRWSTGISRIQEVLDAHRLNAQIWITEAGFSTEHKNERRQVKEFINAICSNADRVYWNGLSDSTSGQLNDTAANRQASFFGMKNADDSPKLLYTLLAAKGIEGIKKYEWMTEPVIGSTKSNEPYTLITGGSGFVGVNLADRLLSEGKKVMVFDNLSRAGVENNLFWLKEQYPDNLLIMIADIRDKAAVAQAVSGAGFVFHFAAQVAVTSSLVNPFHDFEVNAQGTLILLEAIRQSAHQPPIVFTSTNKVYGDLHDLGIVMNGTRYHPENKYFRQHGISEERNLDFHSPYGCTKGVADQYILDYARTFGLNTAVFRMSCIYGPHQFGTEDQGWVAHFLIQALKNKPITLYGDGKQVRDILFVEDLVEAFLLAQKNIETISGNAFNMGGGVHNTVSLLELCDMIGTISGKKPQVQFADWRPSDQKYYVSDFGKFSRVTGWKPLVNTTEGVTRLYEWLQENALVPVKKKESRKQKLTSTV